MSPQTKVVAIATSTTLWVGSDCPWPEELPGLPGTMWRIDAPVWEPNNVPGPSLLISS